MNRFHAHVYYTPGQRQIAADVRDRIRELLKDREFHIGELLDREVGPHTRPMFEFHFSDHESAAVIATLEHSRGELSVLIHPVQSNEFDAHTRLARWLGPALELRLEVLR